MILSYFICIKEYSELDTGGQDLIAIHWILT